LWGGGATPRGGDRRGGLPRGSTQGGGGRFFVPGHPWGTDPVRWFFEVGFFPEKGFFSGVFLRWLGFGNPGITFPLDVFFGRGGGGGGRGPGGGKLPGGDWGRAKPPRSGAKKKGGPQPAGGLFPAPGGGGGGLGAGGGRGFPRRMGGGGKRKKKGGGGIGGGWCCGFSCRGLEGGALYGGRGGFSLGEKRGVGGYRGALDGRGAGRVLFPIFVFLHFLWPGRKTRFFSQRGLFWLGVSGGGGARGPRGHVSG